MSSRRSKTNGNREEQEPQNVLEVMQCLERRFTEAHEKQVGLNQQLLENLISLQNEVRNASILINEKWRTRRK